MNSHIYTDITYSQVSNNWGWGWEYWGGGVKFFPSNVNKGIGIIVNWQGQGGGELKK